MSRRTVAVTVDLVSRSIKGAQKAGIEIKTIRIVAANGDVVINGDNGDITEEQIAEGARGYL